MGWERIWLLRWPPVAPMQIDGIRLNVGIFRSPTISTLGYRNRGDRDSGIW